MRERGLCVDHTTIYRWVQRYAPEIDKRCRPFLRRTNDSYRIDETYVRVAGAWTYLYRGVDSNGDTLDFLLRATRDRKAAIAFFRKTLGAAHTTPARVVTVDKNPAYPVAFEAVRHEGLVRPRSNLRQCKYLNNIIEQDHRFIKRRTRPMLGFKRFTTAWRTLRGIEIMHALRKGQARWMAKGRRGRADAADPQGVRIGRVTRSTQRILARDPKPCNRTPEPLPRPDGRVRSRALFFLRRKPSFVTARQIVGRLADVGNACCNSTSVRSGCSRIRIASRGNCACRSGVRHRVWRRGAISPVSPRRCFRRSTYARLTAYFLRHQFRRHAGVAVLEYPRP